MGDAMITKICKGPDMTIVDQRFSRSGELVDVEEVGTLWLWAWPELLQWPAPISWLFSPVTGNAVWPGDLWGIDSTGRLLIVETKLALTPVDPFEDFLAFERAAKFPSASALKERWVSLLKDERNFIREHRDALLGTSDGRATWSGVVPYSSKRYVVWRWRSLYATRIAPLIENTEYEDGAIRALGEFENTGDRSPHYFGVFTAPNSRVGSLSPVGEANLDALRACASAGRVHIRALTATKSAHDEVSVTSSVIAA
jgi:hypothetical protein